MSDAPATTWRNVAEDAFLGLAALALVLSLAWPRVERALLERRVLAAQADVEAVRTAAAALRTARQAWPRSAGPGEIPPDLAGLLPDGFSFRGSGYVLGWERWETVAAPPPEPTPIGFEELLTPPLVPLADSVGPVLPEVGELAGVTVRARDTRLLAALLDRFGSQRSFVRDETWTLVLTEE